MVELKKKIIGKTMTLSSIVDKKSGTKQYVYWTLTFIDENNIEYKYTSTIDKEEIEKEPINEGIYPYELIQDSEDNYVIETNDEKYLLKVNDSGEPSGIAYYNNQIRFLFEYKRGD